MVPGARAQTAYRAGDTVEDFPLAYLLNNKAPAGKLSDISKELTIIDFFGTWCVPCIKALPLLERIKQQQPDRLAVLLVSVETKEKLQQFMAAKKDVSLLLAADVNKKISSLFEPPSYPYTIVLNKNRQIIAITEAALITNEQIDLWLSQTIAPQPTSNNISSEIYDTMIKADTPQQNEVAALSQELLYAVKTGSTADTLQRQLAELSFEELLTALPSDDYKKAFWINVYNAFTQIELKKDSDKYKKRSAFFKAKNITVGGKRFSLDDIEHGLLRRSKNKLSLGYFNTFFPGRTEKLLRVEKLDYRIHFALNCGAKSCPPIAFYSASDINQQLDLATAAFLTSDATYLSDKNELLLPAFMGWFRGDFGGKKKMISLAKKYNIVPADKKPSVHFKKYDWSVYLDNYKQ